MLIELLALLAQGREKMGQAIVFVKEKGNDYMDLFGKQLVDIAVDLIIGYLFCAQASTEVDMQVPVASANGSMPDGRTIPMRERKAMLAQRFVTRNSMKIPASVEAICSGDTSTFKTYETLIGPVPVE